MHSYTKYFPVRGADDQLDVAGILFSRLAANSQQSLLEFDGESWPVARMGAHVAAAQALLEAHRIEPGDRVAVMVGNSPMHIALIYALILSGVVWVPINTRYKSASIEYVLGHCRPSLLIADSAFSDVVQKAVAAFPNVKVLSSDAFSEHTDCDRPVRRSRVVPDWPLCLMYTSGTTGAPKGVVFTHRMMRIASESALIVAGVQDGDKLFLWEPLCHIGGAQMLMVPFLSHTCLAVVTRFSASRFWQQIDRGGCTQLHYLGGILDILMRQPAPSRKSTLRVAWGAGVGASVWGRVKEFFGVDIRECYGMTEGASFATVNDSGVPGSIGTALPWLTIELLDDEGNPVPTGELGQIVVSSQVDGNFMPEYLGNPEATAQALRDGKLYTGDMARADSRGNFYFVGRRTDSMRVRGENVSAWEVERIFLEYEGVSAVAAVGVTPEVGEQEILLYVQWDADTIPDYDRLVAWAKERLASFQLPRYYKSIEHFERTPSERIRKHLLPRDVGDAVDCQRLAQEDRP